MAVKWLKVALENTAMIANDVTQDSPARATTFVQALCEKTNVYAAFSGVGRAGRVAGTHELVSDKIYLVIYRVKETNVEIIRVRHVAQKYPTKIQ